MGSTPVEANIWITNMRPSTNWIGNEIFNLKIGVQASTGVPSGYIVAAALEDGFRAFNAPVI